MAKYLHDKTASIKNKLGGLVYGTTSTARTYRAMVRPTTSSAPSARASRLASSRASALWQVLDGDLQFPWVDFIAWVESHGHWTDDVYHNPYTVYYQCQQTAATLGVATDIVHMPEFPPAPPPIAQVTMAMSHGTLTASAYNPDATLYAGPFILFVTPNISSIYNKPSATGGTLIGGAVSGGSFDATAAFLTAYGWLPDDSTRVMFRAVALYPYIYFKSSQFIGCLYVSES
jgi:hypothetical protein